MILKVFLFRFFSIFSLLNIASADGAQGPMRLWFEQPARDWTEALPVGNGRLGGMIFGGIEKERIQFNDDTLWTGHPHEYQHAGAVAYLPRIRKLLSDGLDRLILKGHVEQDGLEFEAQLRVITDGGSVSVKGNELSITNANSATLLLAGATSFKNYRDISADPSERCAATLKAVEGKSYQQLLSAHIEDYQRLCLGHAQIEAR